jgi:hypothetical protein
MSSRHPAFPPSIAVRQSAASHGVNGGQGKPASCQMSPAGAATQTSPVARRYHTALGSAQETLACLDAAEACGYVAAVDDALVQQLRRVVGTLVKLVAA